MGYSSVAHLSSQFKSNGTLLHTLKSKDKRRSPIEEIGTQEIKLSFKTE
jgi:hypothetical protein